MATSVHPTAIVEDGARLGEDVVIGAYAHVGAGVELADRVHIHPRGMVIGHTRLGEEVQIHPGAVIGGDPQILGFKPDPSSRLEIGARTIIREHCSIHTGSPAHGGLTRIGSDCLFMAQSHAGHDCKIGDKCVIANSVQIGGHVEVGFQVWMGGAVAVHQFNRIGDHAFIGGGSILVADVIPFAAVTGNHAQLSGLNITGLKRRGFSRATLHTLRAAYRNLFEAPGAFSDRLDDTAEKFADSGEVMQIVTFIRNGKKRALCRPR